MKSPIRPSHVSVTMEFIKGWQRRLLIFPGCMVLIFCASPTLAQALLGTSQSFGVLGASAVTNTGPTTVTGGLGVSPGTSTQAFLRGM